MGWHISGYGLDEHRGRFASVVAVRRPELPRPLAWAAQPISTGAFRAYALAHRADVYHATSYKLLLPPRRNRARVVTFLDCVEERHAALWGDEAGRASSIKRSAATRSDGILCISRSTQRDLIELYGVPEEKTAVTYLASSLSVPPDGTRPVAEPYLLNVGARWSYKNFDTLLRAFASTPRLHKHFRLIAFGAQPASAEELRLIDELKIVGRVDFLRGDDQMLANLYAAAAALVYPSKYEGFGLPPLEAMSYGCPVVSSNTSSLPEVVGDAGLMFDPNSVEEMAHQTLRVVEDPSLRDRLIEAGRGQHAKFSWDRCAAETLEFYRRFAR
jgi:glycosyltransferase involved in cell wall biosynthesis